MSLDNWIEGSCIQEPYEKFQGKTVFKENANYYLDNSKLTKVNMGYVSNESFVVLNVLDKNIEEWKRDPVLELDNVKSIYTFFIKNGYKPLTIEVSYEDIYMVSPHLEGIVKNKKIQSFTVYCLTRSQYNIINEFNENEPVIVYQM